jgi:replicative DNA helicase
MQGDQEDSRMEMGAFTGALVALLAKDMASAIAGEMGKDVSGAVKQALRRLRQRLRREPDTRAAMEQLEADPSDPAVQERLAEQLTRKLEDPAFREELRSLFDELDRQVASAVDAEDRLQEEVGESRARMPAGPDAAATSAGTRPVHDELVTYLQELERRADGGMGGVPTGFPDLDLLTGGLQAGTLNVIAGPTAAGTSTFGLDLARTAAIRAGVPTVVFTLDLTGGQVIHRLLCAEGPIDSHRLLLGRLDERDWTRLTRVLGRIAFAPLTIDASPTLTVATIAAACRQLRERTGLGLVVIDEVAMVQPARPLDDPAQGRAEVARSLKLMARELAVPVVALSRLPEPRRPDRRPMLADLPEGERQAASLVVLLHRPELDDPWTPRRDEADLILAKHQSGPTDVVTVVFQGQYARFAPMATRGL